MLRENKERQNSVTIKGCKTVICIIAKTAIGCISDTACDIINIAYINIFLRLKRTVGFYTNRPLFSLSTQENLSRHRTVPCVSTGITDPKVQMYGPVVSTVPGPIVVWDVKIVG